MGYIGDPNSFLLAYATDTPSVEEPSAGYIFTWDMLENGIFASDSELSWRTGNTFRAR